MQNSINLLLELVKNGKWQELTDIVRLLFLIHENEKTDQAINSIDNQVKDEAKVLAEAQTALNNGPGQS